MNEQMRRLQLIVLWLLKGFNKLHSLAEKEIKNTFFEGRIVSFPLITLFSTQKRRSRRGWAGTHGTKGARAANA